jgi:anti-sigma B factor antagonist
MSNLISMEPTPDLELPESTFEVRWETDQAIGIVEAVGEVDLATIPAFKAALIEAAEADEGLIIDLSRVIYMDSSGFGTLLEVNRALRPLGLPMFLVGANANISRMLEITRLNSLFSLGDSVADALSKIGSLVPA